MKVALIGNMNNNFFSVMRYLRDLGVDAHLFMYQNEYEHFKPEKDTYFIEKYTPYIHTLSVKPSVKGVLFLDKKKIKEELAGYDVFMGCTIAPAIFYKLNMTLDVIAPHDDGIEYTSYPKVVAQRFFTALARRYVVNLQIKGLQHNTTKIIASAVQEITNDTLTKFNWYDKLIKKYLLMVYPEKYKNSDLTNIIESMSGHDLVLFSHTRHIWREESMIEDYIIKDGGKALDKLIIAYSHFIKSNPDIKPLLLFFEYGDDVEASKALIAEHKIQKYVKWLPLMARKDILQLIDHADIVIDSLGASMWSGVGWEALSRGKVIMQNILQTDEEYYKEMGHKLPFIMRANQVEEVEHHLNDFIQNKEKYAQKAKDNREWFDTYAGVGLAKDYKKIIEELYQDKIK
jgi:uncharacterized membrane protein required for colicin V production